MGCHHERHVGHILPQESRRKMNGIERPEFCRHRLARPLERRRHDCRVPVIRFLPAETRIAGEEEYWPSEFELSLLVTPPVVFSRE